MPTIDQARHRVSVIIPAYNAAGFIRKAVDSVLSQTWTNREIIVVNDGSSDHTLKVLESYENKINIVNKVNGGLPGARNRGILAATGEYVAFLDADDRWLPGKLERQAEILATEPNVGFCSTHTLVETPDGTASGEWTCPCIEGTLLKTLFLRNGAIPGSGSGVMARRSLFEHAGLFDESLRSLEDIDMWMRLAAITDYACVHEPLTVIIKHPDSMSRNLDTMRAAALWVMQKNRGLLAPEDRGKLWRAGYANVLADYAKWEYRAGRRMQAMSHLLQGFGHSPIHSGRMIAGLLLAMALGQPI